MSVEGKSSDFLVTGIVKEVGSPAIGYLSPDIHNRMTGLTEHTNAIRVSITDHNDDQRQLVKQQIQEALELAGIRIQGDLSETELDEAIDNHVFILILSLILMAVLMAIVGAIGLMSAMGTNVLERTREFGIMRTIGGKSSTILRNIIGEGVFIGFMSWLLAILLSVPLTALVGSAIGNLFFQNSLPLVMSPVAIFIWLTIVVLGSAAASAYPAWKASQLTIQATLHSN